jgi:ribonuclease HII
MVMAAVCLDTRAARILSRAGVRDSKAYGASDRARAERALLAARIRAHAQHVEVRVVDVAEIDRSVRCQQLNVLEREVAEDMITCSPGVDSIIADGRHLFRPLTVRYLHLVACDGAESRHAAVAAASIIAKHRRDQIFACIARRYQPLFGEVRGGGYGNAATRQFLRAYAQRFGRLPPEARHSWPYPYLLDILGAFDPYADIDDRQAAGQLSLL